MQIFFNEGSWVDGLCSLRRGFPRKITISDVLICAPPWKAWSPVAPTCCTVAQHGSCCCVEGWGWQYRNYGGGGNRVWGKWKFMTFGKRNISSDVFFLFFFFALKCWALPVFIVTPCIVVELLIYYTKPLHIYKIYTLKTRRHVSVLRSSSGSYIFPAACCHNTQLVQRN